MIRDELRRSVEEALQKIQGQGDIPRFDIPVIPIAHPREEAYGDYATPVCLQLAGMTGTSPHNLAEKLIANIKVPSSIERVDVAGPGYVNFTLDSEWLCHQVETILREPCTYGNVDLGRGKRVQVEFISANPTGSLTIGSGRNAVLGDTLANLLQAARYEVEREYLINDFGSQIDLFGETVYARYLQALGHNKQLPKGGYPAEEITMWGQEIAAAVGDKFVGVPQEAAIPVLRDLGLEKALTSIRKDCERLKIKFNRWFSERSLYAGETSEVTLALLKEGGHVYTKDGAVWFNAQEIGCEKDEVLIRSNGEPTYFASDAAYHYDKFIRRSFDWVINVWGADHYGHVPRMKAMMRALGLDPGRLTLLIYQLVALRRSGEPVKMSKRLGTAVSLSEVLNEVGPDAFRFFLLARSAGAHMELDLDLAKAQTEKNPVVYVQYAHTRAAGVMRKSRERGQFAELAENVDLALLEHPSEVALIRKLVQLPEVIKQAVEMLAPDQLVPYAHDLAAVFNTFYRDCRVVSDEPEKLTLSKARLCLAYASKIVLGRVLALMGISAPEWM